MGLPKQVEELERKANELISQNTNSEQPEQALAKLDENNFEPQSKSSNDESDHRQFQAQEDESSNDPVWEHKFKVLQGKFNKELPELHQKLRRAEQIISEQSKEIDLLTSKLNASNHANNSSLDDVRNEYGDDFIEAVNKITGGKTQSQPQENTQRQQSAPLLDPLVSLEQVLALQGIDFNTVNDSQEFITWLEAIDPNSGLTRNQIMNNAYQSGDIQRTANFFILFEQSKNGATPQKPSSNLRKEAAPRNKGGSNVQGQPKAWTRQMIDEFYSKAAKGYYTDEEERRIEAEIHASLGMS